LLAIGAAEDCGVYLIHVMHVRKKASIIRYLIYASKIGTYYTVRIQSGAYSEKEVYETSRIQTCPSTSTNNCASVLYSRINIRWLTKGHILVAAVRPSPFLAL